MNIRLGVIISLSLSCASAVHAQDEPRQVIENCFSAAADDNDERVKDAAQQLTEMRNIVNSKDRVDAAYCLQTAYGERWIYEDSLNRMVPARLREVIIETENLVGEAAEDYQRLNQNTIDSEIFESCAALYQRDKITTMTKPLCVESFRQNSHPKLPRLSEYTSGVLEEHLQALSADERKILQEFFDLQ